MIYDVKVTYLPELYITNLPSKFDRNWSIPYKVIKVFVVLRKGDGQIDAAADPLVFPSPTMDSTKTRWTI